MLPGSYVRINIVSEIEQELSRALFTKPEKFIPIDEKLLIMPSRMMQSLAHA